MPDKHLFKRDYVKYHADSVWARGNMVDGQPDGYWEWFRKDGIKMGSDLSKGREVGEWTTYDKKGKVYKVTRKM